jgi:hypothetical protein
VVSHLCGLGTLHRKLRGCWPAHILGHTSRLWPAGLGKAHCFVVYGEQEQSDHGLDPKETLRAGKGLCALALPQCHQGVMGFSGEVGGTRAWKVSGP